MFLRLFIYSKSEMKNISFYEHYKVARKKEINGKSGSFQKTSSGKIIRFKGRIK